MCGLFGWQWDTGNLPPKGQRASLARLLAVANDSRGGQAWGVWSPAVVMRGLGEAAENYTRFAQLDSMFGHSRWATHGKNIIENAHPFHQDGVYLSHNGVVSNHRDLNREHNRSFEVDSQHILAHLVAERSFTELHAYGAVTWAKADQPNIIYMGRLNERGVLAVAKTKHGVVWSSEKDALLGALAQSDIRLEHTYSIEAGKAYLAEGGTLYEPAEGRLPSIKVGEAPTPIRSWESYGWDSDYGVTRFTPSGNDQAWVGYAEHWCNEHLKRWSQCPCPAAMRGQPHIVKIKGKDTPVPGQQYIPAPDPQATPPSVKRPLSAVPTAEATSPSSAWDQYVLQLEDEEAAKEAADMKAEVQLDLAKEYIEDTVGLSPRALDGYSDTGVMQLAVQYGFSPEDAWAEVADHMFDLTTEVTDA